MPNHVETIVTVTGDDKEIQSFIDTCIVEQIRKDYQGNVVNTDDGKPETFMEFDFNTIIPCPEELEGTRSPAYNQSDLDRAYNNDWSEDQIQEIKDGIKIAEECKKKYGFSNWYDFKISNWGTKWGAYRYMERQREKGLFAMEYQTAWSPACPIFEKLIEMYPGLTFEMSFIDEGWCFAGTMVYSKDGIVETVVEGNSNIAQFANNNFGGSYEQCTKCEMYSMCLNDDNLCEDCEYEKEQAEKEEAE